MWVYTGNKDGVTGWVKRDPETQVQCRQANTEMRHDFGHPGEVVFRVMNAHAATNDSGWGMLKRINDD